MQTDALVMSVAPLSIKFSHELLERLQIVAIAVPSEKSHTERTSIASCRRCACAGAAMWSRPLALALLPLPAPALAGVKEKVAALAPPALELGLACP